MSTLKINKVNTAGSATDLLNLSSTAIRGSAAAGNAS